MKADRKPKVEVDVAKSFNHFPVLERVRFTVHENEFVCILGPTGCGKTTLARLVTGLLSPTAGRVLIDGQPADPRRQNISLVFQEPSCLPWKTVKANVQFALDTKGITGRQAEERIKRVLEIVALTGYEDYYPRQISGGMKQRVAIARAFVTDPEIMVMDEPFAHLDAQTRYYMGLELRRIWRQLRRTVIFITNNIEEAVLLGERVLVLTDRPVRVDSEYHIQLPVESREATDQAFIEERRRVSELWKAAARGRELAGVAP